MDMLTKSLLTGAAVSALAAVPAMASLHMAGSNNNALVLHNGSTHSKTTFSGIKTPHTTYSNVTQTATISFSGNESTLYKHAKHVANVGWYTYTVSGGCFSIPGQKGKAKKDPHAKVKLVLGPTHLSTSHCHATISLFAVNYTLKDKNATSDHFTTTATKKKWTTTGGGHYNLKAIDNFNVTIN